MAAKKPVKIKWNKTQSLGQGTGLYTQITIKSGKGKGRSIWVTQRGARELRKFNLEGKTFDEVFKVARQYGVKAQASKKETFKQRMVNALEASDASQEQIDELKKRLDAMSDSEIADWAERNKDALEEVLDYEYEFEPYSTKYKSNRRAEREASINRLILSFEGNRSIFDYNPVGKL